MSLSAIVFAIFAAGIASWFLAPGIWAGLILWMLRRHSGLTAHSMNVDGMRWHYLSGGQGPVMVLLHGFGGDSHNWLLLARQLRHRFTLVIPDLPGFGNSAPPQRLRFDMDSQVERLDQFVAALDLGPCLFAGNSMGGYLAAAFAARRAQRVKALWLLAPLGVRAIEPGNILQEIDLGDLDYLQISSVTDYKANTVAHMFHRKPWIPGPVLRALAKRAQSMQEDAPRMLKEARFESEPLESLAQHVYKPVLLHWGELDKVTNPAGLTVLKKAFPDAHSELLPECGHLPMLECPQASHNLFLDFYRQRFGD